MSVETMIKMARELPIDDRKRLITLIIDSLTEDTNSPSRKKRSILEFEGLGAEMWEGIDSTQFINDMRDEWDKPREG